MKKIIKFINSNFYLRNIISVLALTLILLIVLLIYLRIYTHHGQALSVPELKGYELKEAEKILSDRHLKCKVIDSVYVTDKKGGIIIGQIPESEFKVKRNRTIFLTINAYSPEKVIMPNVVGYSYRQATAVLYTRGLQLGRIKYVPGIAPQMVQKQRINGEIIAEGDTIIKGSKIDLEVSSGPGDHNVLVPDLISLPVKEARIKLNEAYLNLGGEIPDNTIHTEEDKLAAFIFRQKPNPENRKRLPMGSVVDVWITIDSTKLPSYDSLQLIKESLYEPD